MKLPNIGLMGLKSDGTLVTPNGKDLFRVPFWLGSRIQRIQHWVSAKTWRYAERTAYSGGPAFPCTEDNYADPRWSYEGMTLRDYFAAKAISGACADSLPDKLYCEVAAKRAYELADAMLKAREA